MIDIRRAEERGHFQIEWLDSYHTFSFGEYYDAKYMGFRNLRVINDDRVKPRMGFGTHPHKEMEIITYVLEGSLEHKDSMASGSVIKPSDVQLMSAGTGVTHSEYNPSPTEEVHLLQIWIIPNKKAVSPSYQQKFFEKSKRQNKLCLIVSPSGKEGSLKINQDASLFCCLLSEGKNIEYMFQQGRHAWLQIASGCVKLNGTLLKAGDGAAVSEEKKLDIEATEDAEFLLFDLA